MLSVTRYFAVNTPEGMSDIKLDSKGCATCQITVKNVSGAALDGRATLVSLPITRPPAGAVEKNWIEIDGPAERHFEIDQDEVFSIRIAVRQQKAAPASAGNYTFRLDLVNVARPDESSDQSQALRFAVAAAPPARPSRWPLIAAVAAGVLVVAGLAIWLLSSGKTVASSTPVSATVPSSTPVATIPSPTPVSAPVPSSIPVCATANEHDQASLSCPSGLKIVGLAFASYGTPVGSCAQFSTSSCHAAGSAAVVSQLCEGRPGCTVPVENYLFGDPCPTIPKRLYIQATCK